MSPLELCDGELILRRARVSESRQLTRAVQASLPELGPYLPWATPDYDFDAARAFLDFARAEDLAGRGLHLSIFLAAGGELIGGVGLLNKPIPDQAEIGYWVHSQHAGQGYATQASAMLIGHGFKKLSLRRVYLTCDVKNRASQRVAEKLGMHREGRLREYLECQGRVSDHYLYSLLKREFVP